MTSWKIQRAGKIGNKAFSIEKWIIALIFLRGKRCLDHVRRHSLGPSSVRASSSTTSIKFGYANSSRVRPALYYSLCDQYPSCKACIIPYNPVHTLDNDTSIAQRWGKDIAWSKGSNGGHYEKRGKSTMFKVRRARPTNWHRVRGFLLLIRGRLRCNSCSKNKKR